MNRIYSFFYTIIFILLLTAVTATVSCTKQADAVSPSVQQPVTPGPPLGDIISFTLNDSLIPFNSGSVVKWVVTGTNTSTVVTFNGIKVANNGALETGPLKQNTTYTLAINNGKQASLTLKVADTLTTLLWGKGRRLKQTKLEYYMVPPGQTDPVWIDTPMTARVADQRIFFTLTGNSVILQSVASSNVSSGDAGQFVVDIPTLSYTWQGVLYKIENVDNNGLIVTYEAVLSNGITLHARNTYMFE